MDIVADIISLFALFVSCYSIWRSRKVLDVSFDKNIILNQPKMVFGKDKNNSNAYYHGTTYVASISIINPSPIDMSYFDLRAFDPDTNLNFDYVTKWTISNEIPDKKFIIGLLKIIIDMHNWIFQKENLVEYLQIHT